MKKIYLGIVLLFGITLTVGCVPFKQISTERFSFNDFGNQVFANGTWKSNEDEGIPHYVEFLNSSRIECNMSSLECRVVVGYIFEGTYLTISTDEIKIIKWDEKEVIAEGTYGDTCYKRTLNIDRLSETVSMIYNLRIDDTTCYPPKVIFLTDG